MQVSFTPEFAERLRADLRLDQPQNHNPLGAGNRFELERALGSDMLLTSVCWANSYYQSGPSYTDEWGIGWLSSPYSTPFGQGHFTEIVGHPLGDARSLDSYTPPDPARPELYTESEQVLASFQPEYWIAGAVVTTIFETAWALRGYERLLLDFVEDPVLANAILDIPYRYHLAAAERLTRLGVDMIWLGDDVGAQHSMIISPASWRRFFKPRMAHLIASLKTINPKVKVAYHSDGCIYPIIGDLIEIGLDILNPIQPASMDPGRLKQDYGQRLCFWGSIDEQQTLPFGTPADVRLEVLTRLHSIGRDGGLIIGPTHHVQLDTPMENFRAMIDTITQTPYRAPQ
jgi:uroporphyrinogen decarboxylase